MTRNSPAIPATTPISAVSRVIPAATSEPNVTTSTTAATATPMISVGPISGGAADDRAARHHPQATAEPAWSSRSKASLVSVDSWSAGLLNCTLIRPVPPSGLIALLVNGSTTPASSGSCLAAATAASTAGFIVGLVRVCPAGAFTTTLAEAPLAAGMSFCNASRARCDSVPGIEKVFVVCPPSVTAPTPSAITSTAQTAATSRRR